jgi:hypothetical protein
MSMFIQFTTIVILYRSPYILELCKVISFKKQKTDHRSV